MCKGALTISKDQGNVAVLFCDICEFDKIVVAEKERLVYLLDGLFRSFDKLCFNFKVQKIETVGKTYMACAGLKEYEYENLLDGTKSENSTTRILSLALEMMKQARQYKWGDSLKEFELKIGIHYGTVLAGVIGFHKPQFSLIGDTVNTTSRVCSTGQSGKIIISEAAYEQLNDKYIDKYRFIEKSVEAKGKGTLKTYTLENKLITAEQIGFNKGMAMSKMSPKHSFFNSPLHKKSPTLSNFSMGMSLIMQPISNGKEICSAALPERNAYSGKKLHSLIELEKAPLKNYQNVLTNSPSPHKIAVIDEENESGSLFSPKNLRKISSSKPGSSIGSKNKDVQHKGPISDFGQMIMKENPKPSISKNEHETQLLKMQPLEEDQQNITERVKMSKGGFQKPLIFSEKKIVLLNSLQSCFSAPNSSDHASERTGRRMSSYPLIKRQGSFKKIFQRIVDMLGQVKGKKGRHKKSKSLDKTDKKKTLESSRQLEKKGSSPELVMSGVIKPILEEQVMKKEQEKLECIIFGSEENSIQEEIASQEQILIQKQQQDAHLSGNFLSQNILSQNGSSRDVFIDIGQNRDPQKQTILIPNFKETFEEFQNNVTMNPGASRGVADLIIEEQKLSPQPPRRGSSKGSKGSISGNNWKPRSPQSNTFSSPKIMNVNLVKTRSRNRLSGGVSLQSLEIEGDEEIEEFYRCLEKKPKFLKNLNDLKKSMMRHSGLDIVSQQEENRSESILRENRFWLNFSNEQNDLADAFYKRVKDKNAQNDLLNLCLVCLFVFGINCFKFCLPDRYIYAKELLGGIMSFIFAIIIFWYFSPKLGRLFKPFILLFFSIFVAITFEAFNLNKQIDSIVPKLEISLVYYTCSHLSFLCFRQVLIITLIYFVVVHIMQFVLAEDGGHLLANFFSFGIWNIGILYFRNKMEIDFFNKMRVTDYEKKRLNEMIQYLLPPHVSINLKFINFVKFFIVNNFMNLINRYWKKL